MIETKYRRNLQESPSKVSASSKNSKDSVLGNNFSSGVMKLSLSPLKPANIGLIEPQSHDAMLDQTNNKKITSSIQAFKDCLPGNTFDNEPNEKKKDDDANNQLVPIMTKQITDSFYIRPRSVRKTKVEIETEKNRDIINAVIEEKEEGLEVKKKYKKLCIII